MIKREIEVCGKLVPFRSSATIPRLYRAKFKRDIFKDLARLEKSFKANSEDGESFAIDDLEIFENVAYVMAYHADNTMGGLGSAPGCGERLPGQSLQTGRTPTRACSNAGVYLRPAPGRCGTQY